MCDLDHFKWINDRLGHEFGDAALRHVADVLREAARQDDLVVARVGGEEFALLLTDVMRADAFVFAEKLRMSVAERPVEWAGAKATITMSIGFAATPSWQGQLSQLLARADAALYEAKRGGRNRVVLAREYSPRWREREAKLQRTITGGISRDKPDVSVSHFWQPRAGRARPV